jgi:hypothetical protein
MAISTLSLPVDIPWIRIGVSEDMIDPNPCDRQFPFRWRPSVAMFSYEPGEEYQTYHGMIVTYLKVTFTITGFQPTPDEVGLSDRRVDSHWSDPQVIKNYLDVVEKYYPCNGAILEVAVTPSERELENRDIPLVEYPYIADFEPKKRELYEAVTETGEVMSRSLDSVNVKKGNTTTEGHEDLQNTSVGVKAGGEILGIGVTGTLDHSWGSKDMNNRQVEDVRTTDASREGRENTSHTTQLTQMYHELSSYHLGTNRVVHFMLPRPHIVEPKDDAGNPLRTFVNGPRQLEGIQEVFLTVLRPSTILELGVEAYLETAHIADETAYTERIVTAEDHLVVHDRQPVDRVSTMEGQTYSPGTTKTYKPSGGFELDSGRGYAMIAELPTGTNFTTADYKILSADATQVTASARCYSMISKETEGEGEKGDLLHTVIRRIAGAINLDVKVFLRKKELVPSGPATKNLWLTGRGVCASSTAVSTPKEGLKEAVTWEGQLPTRLELPVNGSGLTMAQANQIRADVGRRLLESIHSRDRYPAGTVQFSDTQFVARTVASSLGSVDHPENLAVVDIPGLDQAVAAKLAEAAPGLSRIQVLQMTTQEQVDRFDLSQDESLALRRAVLGLAGPPPAPADRWPPEDTGGQVVPDMAALPLEAARRALAEVGLRIGSVTYADSSQPVDSVVRQHPGPGHRVPTGSGIGLTLATGAVVFIPDVVGAPLSQALVMLRDAGLESEPRLTFTSSDSQPEGHVVAVEPEPRTYTTPRGEVTLSVAGA